MKTPGPSRVILVSGRLAAVPNQGGAAWAVLQYLLGLRRLGHEVYFIEPIPAESLPPNCTLSDLPQAKYFSEIVRRFGLENSAGLFVDGANESIGIDYAAMQRISRRADALINLSGLLKDHELIDPIAVRIYVDLDPAFTQLWHVHSSIDMGFDAHTHFATVGTAIGKPDCSVLTAGRNWTTIFPPVVLEHWPASEPVDNGAFTSIGNWRSYGSIQIGETYYGQRAHSFRSLMHLPQMIQQRIQMALSIHPDESRDLMALDNNGWNLLDAAPVAAWPEDYRAFIQQSKAELGIAKQGYVASACGWFSDRSACYMASGRPVVVQETGVSGIPTGEGFLAFRTVEEAAANIETVAMNYRQHCRAARALAERFFDSDLVLSALLRESGLA